MSPKKKIYPFVAEAATKQQQLNMDILSVLEQAGPVSPQELARVAEVEERDIEKFVSTGFKTNLLQLTENGALEFRTAPVRMLGVAFSGEECSLKVVDPRGNIVEDEKIKVLSVDRHKGTKTDTNKIARSIKTGSDLKRAGLACCGLAVPQAARDWSREVVELLAFSLQKIFKCPVYMTSEQVASGYAQRNAEGPDLGSKVLYVHSDTGLAVVFKKGLIYESGSDATGLRSYLRDWAQLGLVQTAKDLIDRGLGTDMIAMVSGDLDDLEIRTVFQAARAGDELAMDLVKRSALALGVRIAYLVNVFDLDTVLLSKELSADGGVFTRHVKESCRRLFADRKKDSVELVPGTLPESCVSYGAALICRRQLILEV